MCARHPRGGWAAGALCLAHACTPITHLPGPSAQVKEYYGEFNTLERGKGAVLKESQKVGCNPRARGSAARSPPPSHTHLLTVPVAALPQVADLVDKFYSLVTDLYEWGWGQSFHFARRLPARDWSASEVAHEAWAAAKIGLGPGKTALDVGCGVGGPMRTVAAVRWGAAAGGSVARAGAGWCNVLGCPRRLCRALPCLVTTPAQSPPT